MDTYLPAGVKQSDKKNSWKDALQVNLILKQDQTDQKGKVNNHCVTEQIVLLRKCQVKNQP